MTKRENYLATIETDTGPLSAVHDSLAAAYDWIDRTRDNIAGLVVYVYHVQPLTEDQCEGCGDDLTPDEARFCAYCLGGDSL